LGGAMGFIKAKSMPSLVAGLVCGVIALMLGYYYPWRFAPWAALLLSLFLIVIMGRRFLRTRKVMPAGIVVLLSLIVAVTQIYVLLMTPE
jgi:uncharacterized membrane protein (UPF0136 family)